MHSAVLCGVVAHHLPHHATGGFRVIGIHNLSDDEAVWLMRLLRSRPRNGPVDQFTMPDPVHNALVERGLMRWKHGKMEITLDGIRAVGRRRPEGE